MIGTAFVIILNNHPYLISAKHVFEGIREKDTIEIKYRDGWRKISVKPIFFKNSNIDIIAFPWVYEKYDDLDSLGLGAHGIIYGQGLFFFGYPYGTITLFNGPEGDHPLPFVKKGILSAIEPQSEEGTILYIDGHVVRGLSGGPVLFYNYSEKRWAICGVIREFLVVKKPEKEIEEIIDENSGIFAAVAMEHVIEMIVDYQNLSE